MKPSAFALEQPDTLEQALDIRGDNSVYTVALAGGQSLMPLLNLRLSSPDVVLDLNRIHELSFIRQEGDRLVIGAMTRQAHVEDHDTVGRWFPALPRMISLIGHRTIRNRGTVGGSLCHADPSAELPALALAADAELVASSRTGTRVISAADFNQGYLSNELDATELLTEIRWPLQSGRDVLGGAQFIRRSGDFAIAAVIVLLRYSDQGSIAKVRVVAYGSLPRPMRLEPVEEALAENPSSVSAHEMEELCRSLVQPSSDLHGRTEYKRQLFGVMCRRAIEDVAQQLRGEAA